MEEEVGGEIHHPASSVELIQGLLNPLRGMAGKGPVVDESEDQTKRRGEVVSKLET